MKTMLSLHREYGSISVNYTTLPKMGCAMGGFWVHFTLVAKSIFIGCLYKNALSVGAGFFPPADGTTH